MDIRPWLTDIYAPAVIVAATPAAEAIVQTKNGLSLADLLRPYSHVFQLNAPLRVGETSVRIQDLRVRFHDVTSLYQAPPEVIEERLHEVLRAAGQRHAKSDPPADLLQRFMSDRPPSMRELAPWFDEYRTEFLRLLRFGDHETLDHPVACIFAIPADVSQPASHIDTLVAALPLPPLMADSVMYSLRDRDFPRHFLLLLDVGAGMSEKRAMDNLAAMRKLYGDAHVSLLRLNSGNGDPAHRGAPPELFARYHFACLPGGGAGEPLARPPPPPAGVGAFLSVQDLDGVGSFTRDFMSRTLLPRLEERMSRLNAAINASRRGLRNRLNRFWKGAAEERQSDRPYPWHSVEGQMRQLGDLAFLLRQYTLAESTYRLAAQDYLADGNSKWYAGVEEMIGLCSVLGEPADPITAVLLQTDPMKYFMRAYEHYIKPPAVIAAAAAAAAAAAMGTVAGAAAGGAGTAAAAATASGVAAAATVAAASAPPPAVVAASKLGRMLGTRVILLGAAVQCAAGRHRAASEALMRAQSEEENARAGLLLEQSAYSMLYARPPLVRKFAFQLVLAGIRYICCGQKRIAINAYHQVLQLYLGRRWRHIEEHLHAVLGAQCVESGEKERALWHYASLLDCGHRPPAQQVAQVAQFLGLLAGVRDQAAVVQDGVSLVDRLPLPVVNRHDVRVLCADTACYAGPAARAIPDAKWQRLEACCASSGSTNWLTEGGVKQEKDHEEYTPCVVGEEVGVQVEFRNPLAVKLKVTNVQLICQFTPEGDAAASARGGAGPSPLQPAAAAAASSSNPASAAAAGGGEAAVAADGHHPLQGGAPPAIAAQQPASEHVHLALASFTLHPGEAAVEVLRATPRRPGWLRVTGVSWTLNGVAAGRADFDVKGRKRKKPKGNRPGQLKHFPPHRRLLFQALPAMPRLELVGEPLPPALYSGELCRVIMRLRNAGGLPLRSLALVVGHPEAACPATDANMHRPLLEALQDPREVPVLAKVAPGLRSGAGPEPPPQLYRLWPGRQLAPGEVLEWPLWLHPRGLGTLKLPLVWYGEPVAPKGGCAMRHRTLRFCGSVSVQPLLAARPGLVPSGSALAHHLLRLAVDNSKDGEAVVLQQVAAVTVPPLQPAAGAAHAHKQQHSQASAASKRAAAAAGPPPPSSSGAATPTPGAATPTAARAAGGPAGWRLALLGNPSGAGTESTQLPEPSAAAGGGGGAATDGVPPGAARSLPLALPLQPGQSTDLYLQLIAPPVSLSRPAATATHGSATPGPAGGPGSAGISPPPSGAATPGRWGDPAAASAVGAAAVAQAAEAVRSLALGQGGAGVAAGPGARPVPYVEGSDAALQRLNLLAPGILSHFYRRGRRGMVTVPTGPAAGGGGAAAAKGSARPAAAQQGPAGTPGAVPASPSAGPAGLHHSASFSGTPAAASAAASQPHSSAIPRGASFNAGPPSSIAGSSQGAHAAGPGRPPTPSAPSPSPAAAPGGSGPGRPAVAAAGPPLPLADPPLDLLLLWHVAASARTGPAHGQQRLGLCRPYDAVVGRDLSGALQANLAPIRMLLTGPNGASSAATAAAPSAPGPVVRHDFRASPLALLPLRLALRNNTGLEARVCVEVGEGWQSNDAPHSWQASTSVLNTTHGQSLGSLGPGGGPGPGLGAASMHGAASFHAGSPAGSFMAGSMHGALGPGGPPGAAAAPGMQAAAAGPTGGSDRPMGQLPSDARGGGGGGLAGSVPGITYQAGLPPCPEYCWVGPSSLTVPRLEAGGQVELQLAVAVFRPGSYCVTGCRCTAAFEGGGPGAVEVLRAEPLALRVEGA